VIDSRVETGCFQARWVKYCIQRVQGPPHTVEVMVPAAGAALHRYRWCVFEAVL
jgi:hypothetical protein